MNSSPFSRLAQEVLIGLALVFVLCTAKARAQSIYEAPRYFVRIAGSDAFGSDDGFALSAKFKQPMGVVVDPVGNIFVTDIGTSTVRKISPSGDVTTIAGQDGVNAHADGQGTAATFKSPFGIAIDH